MARALITGISGQDGRYLVDLLTTKGYEIFGFARTAESVAPDLSSKATILIGDLLDEDSIKRAVRSANPDEIYHLAAQSVPAASLQQPVLTSEINGSGTVRLLEAARSESPNARICYASTSEIFARTATSPQDESTQYSPRNVYGISKLFGQMATKHYREDFGLHACAAILFNHESPHRPTSFVTRKITNAAAQIYLGQRESVALGDIEARRDWGFAGDYVEAMWRMANHPEPNDYVIGSGVSHSVKDLCEIAFSAVGLDWQDHVLIDPSFARPAETTQLVSNPALAARDLGWSATTTFHQLITLMVRADVAQLENQAGHKSAS